jgi:rod shape-determining protein MreB
VEEVERGNDGNSNRDGGNRNGDGGRRKSLSGKGIAIDLGTANTLVWDAENGMLYNQPTMMALSFNGGRHSDVIGVGETAEELVGRSPDSVEVVRPLRDGVITDLETTRRFLREILADIAPTWLQRRRLSVVIGVPAGATAL